jgi:hypothetical protein
MLQINRRAVLFSILVLAKPARILYAGPYTLMWRNFTWAKAPLCGLALSTLLTAYVNIGGNIKADRAWKRYRNASFGYCVNYPSRWSKSDAFEGAGLFVKTGSGKSSRPTGEIDIGPLSFPLDDARMQPVNLVEDLEAHLDGLRKFERAERLEILSKRDMPFLGNPALFTKNRYYDPLDRATWVEEVLFVNRAQTLYRLELECRADQLARFEPVFLHLLSTFQFDCEASH